MNTFDPEKYTKSRWLKGADLPKGKAVQVAIKSVYERTFEQTGDTKPVVDLVGMDQSIVLNKTQVTALIELFGTDVRVWPGQSIKLMAVPSAYPGKPSILISEGDAGAPGAAPMPVATSPRPKPTGYTREDAARDMARRQQSQPVAVEEPPAWVDDDQDNPF